MTCEELERLLFPYLDGEFDPVERTHFEGHLGSCARCAARLAQERHAHLMLRDAARQLRCSPAPAALRTSVQDGLRREQRRQLTRQALNLSVAVATFVAVGVVTYSQTRPFLRQRYLDDAAIRHAKGFPLEVTRVSARELEAWFGGKLDYRVALPEFPDVVLAGARLLNVKDKQAAYIRYEATTPGRPGGRIGLFVYDDRAGEVDFGPAEAAQVQSSHGYNVVAWRRGDVVYQLVSDLDEADIRRLVSADSSRHPRRPAPTAGSSQASEVRPASLQR